MAIIPADAKYLHALLAGVEARLVDDDGGVGAARYAASIVDDILNEAFHAEDGLERAAIGGALRACAATIERAGLLIARGR